MNPDVVVPLVAAAIGAGAAVLAALLQAVATVIAAWIGRRRRR